MTNTSFFLFLLFLLPITLKSQNNGIEKNRKLNVENAWVKIEKPSLSNKDYFLKNKDKLGLESSNDLKLISTTHSKNQFTHYKYQQFYKKLPVLTGIYILHRKNNKLIKANGNILPNIQIDIKPDFSKEIAIEIAKNHFSKLNNIKPAHLVNSIPALVVADQSYPDFSGNYILAYKLELTYNTINPIIDQYLIDANTGKVINTIPQICFINIDGIAHTRYNGIQKITVDSVSKNRFLLQDFTRGKGIFTVNNYNKKIFSDDDNIWNNTNEFQDEVATDVHFGAISYYDYMKKTFDWDGLDNNGFELRSNVHYNNGNKYVNAFWNGKTASFGDGDCANYDPVTSIDVVAHEFTHGFTKFSSGLIYYQESGALNESISDIFGKALEYYYGLPGTFDWNVGSKFVKSSNAEPFRSMSKPNLYGDPKFYKGENWDPNQEVHTNSGVLNYWFYLICEGGKGINELGIPFDVKAIGIDKAIEIVFLMQTAYLYPSSNYLQAMSAGLEATTDIFGKNSEEYKSVSNAWKAVGLFDSYYFENDIKLTFENRTIKICGKVDKYEVKVNIENNGKSAIPKGTEIPIEYHSEFFGTLIVDYPKSSESFILNTNLAAGDKVEFVFQNKIDVTEKLIFFDLVISTTFNDNYPMNNKISVPLVTHQKNKDLSLNIDYDQENNCNIDDFELQIYVNNDGCEAIPKGTKLKVSITSPKKATFHYTLSSDLHPNQYLIKNESINLGDTRGGDILLLAKLDFADEEKENNSISENIKILRTINSSYKEDFSNFDDFMKVESNYFKLHNKYFIGQKLFEINQDTMLGFYGTKSLMNIFNLNEDCLDIKGFLKNNITEYSSSLEFCLDMEKVFSPKINLDMIQNRVAKQILQMPDSLKTIFKISFPNKYKIPAKYIYNLENKKLNHIQFDIPDLYKGKVLLEMFTILGEHDDDFNIVLDESDYILIDDIEITGLPLTRKGQILAIYPNPAGDYIYFKRTTNSNEEYNLQIFDAIGALVFSMNITDNLMIWDTSRMSTGMYFYKIVSKNKVIDNGKIIIING